MGIQGAPGGPGQGGEGGTGRVHSKDAAASQGRGPEVMVAFLSGGLCVQILGSDTLLGGPD